MNTAKKPVFARLIGALCLALTLFYASSVFIYLNSPVMAQQPMQMAGMEDCHMDMGDTTTPDAPASKNCCSVVGCCPCITPLGFVAYSQTMAQPLQLNITETAQADYLIASRLDRPPRV